jgi:hypothetical protein
MNFQTTLNNVSIINWLTTNVKWLLGQRYIKDVIAGDNISIDKRNPNTPVIHGTAGSLVQDFVFISEATMVDNYATLTLPETYNSFVVYMSNISTGIGLGEDGTSLLLGAQVYYNDGVNDVIITEYNGIYTVSQFTSVDPTVGSLAESLGSFTSLVSATIVSNNLTPVTPNLGRNSGMLHIYNAKTPSGTFARGLKSECVGSRIFENVLTGTVYETCECSAYVESEPLTKIRFGLNGTAPTGTFRLYGIK